MNIAGNFLRTALRVPERTFLVGVDDVPFSYGEILSRARRVCTLLERRRVGAGDRVILTFPNSVDFICAYLGALLRGCVVTLVDYRSLPQHLDFVRRDTGAALWMSPEERRGYEQVPDHIPFPATLDDLAEAPLADLCPEGQPLALIMYTSGTTGTPKGVCLSHANLQHTLNAIAQWAEIRESDRELTTLPLTHLFGLAHIHIYWTLGGSVVLEEALRDVPRVLRRLAAHQATSFPGTPAGFKIVLDRFADDFREASGTLRYIIVNSAPMPEEYVQRMLDLLPDVRFYMYYGLTEASRSTYIQYNAHRDKLRTVGRPTPGSEIAVGSPAKSLIDEVGEILVRGPHVTSGYWKIDSSEYFTDGWFRTGDLGVLDEDGFLTWVGRVKEQINVDGLKVSPAEVEAVLREHPLVADCAVVGADDELTGQAVVGFVVLDGAANDRTEAELRRFCKPKLEFYKIPRRVYFVEAIPRTDSGKVKRLSLLSKLPE
jgi:long-chain acyl-CoA synthetase